MRSGMLCFVIVWNERVEDAQCEVRFVLCVAGEDDIIEVIVIKECVVV